MCTKIDWNLLSSLGVLISKKSHKLPLCAYCCVLKWSDYCMNSLLSRSRGIYHVSAVGPHQKVLTPSGEKFFLFHHTFFVVILPLFMSCSFYFLSACTYVCLLYRWQYVLRCFIHFPSWAMKYFSSIPKVTMLNGSIIPLYKVMSLFFF